MERLMESVFTENAGLIQQFVKPFSNQQSVDLEDHRQAGRLALWKAWLEYDPDGAPFGSYSRNYIRGAVNRSVRIVEKPQITYSEWSAIPEIREAKSSLLETLDREPTVDEIAASTGLTPGVVGRAITPRPASLDAMFATSDDAQGSLYSVVADEEDDQETDNPATGIALSADLANDDGLLASVTAGLSPRQLFVWLLRTGFSGTAPLDLAFVASLSGIDRETCRRLDSAAQVSVTTLLSSPSFSASVTPVTDVPLEDLVKIDEYRAAQLAEFRPTVDQILIIRDDIFALVPASETAQKVGFTLLQLIDVVAQLGTWVARSAKNTFRMEIIPAERASQTALHQPAQILADASRKRAYLVEGQTGFFDEGVAKPLKEKTKKATRAKRKGLLLQKWSHKRPKIVLVPQGYTKSSDQVRDIRKALATIVTQYPDRDAAVRFLARVYPLGRQTMRGELVLQTWRYATFGRLGQMELVNDSPRFLRSIAEAYDVLDVAIIRSREGLQTLIDPSVTDAVVLRDACAKAFWLAERDINRIVHVLDATPATVGNAFLDKERTSLRKHVNENPDRFYGVNAASLTEGQVRRITDANGLSVETPDVRLRASIREQLVDLGLSSDIDQLLPQALAAASHGDLDSFVEILKDRQAGDPLWEERLVALVTTDTPSPVMALVATV
jgi:hypothetical protein